ncbi:MAG: DeoR/GlpR transcriptional regulator [Clostridia bacterium]|nr:DeoR/GlpR transcriptional regulator [Clostridia bacterium]
MYQKERVDKIMQILRENGYVSVKYLCGEVGYSKATVNRDLNFMEKQKMITRSYGAVEIIEKKDVELEFRYHKMKREKLKLCKAAAELVNDGDIIFVDSSSTTEFIAQYLIKKNDVTVITSNTAVVSYLSRFSNIKVICLGGEIMEPPSMLGGELCVKNAMEYKADKLFFSSHGINDDGEIGGGGGYSLLLNVMAKNSKEVIYLVDHTKINLESRHVIMTADNLDVIISDCDFNKNFREKFSKIKYIKIE